MQGLVPRSTFVVGVVCLALAAAAPLAATPPGNAYTVTPLVSDVPGAAPNFDPNLVNGWGLARSATSPWWVADNGTDKSSLYTGSGAVQALAPTVEGGPTGVVFAGIAGNFLVGQHGKPHDSRTGGLHLRQRGRRDPRLARRLDGRTRHRRSE